MKKRKMKMKTNDEKDSGFVSDSNDESKNVHVDVAFYLDDSTVESLKNTEKHLSKVSKELNTMNILLSMLLRHKVTNKCDMEKLNFIDSVIS